MSQSLARVRAALDGARVSLEILEMPDSTRTAADAARAVGTETDPMLVRVQPFATSRAPTWSPFTV